MPLENEIFQKACHVIIWACNGKQEIRETQGSPWEDSAEASSAQEPAVAVGLATVAKEPSHTEAGRGAG